MKLVEAIGKRVEALLDEKAMTQYKLSKLGGIPRSTICLLIYAKNKTVKMDTVYQIAATLRMSLKDFFDDPIFEDISD